MRIEIEIGKLDSHLRCQNQLQLVRSSEKIENRVPRTLFAFKRKTFNSMRIVIICVRFLFNIQWLQFLRAETAFQSRTAVNDIAMITVLWSRFGHFLIIIGNRVFYSPMSRRITMQRRGMTDEEDKDAIKECSCHDLCHNWNWIVSFCFPTLGRCDTLRVSGAQRWQQSMCTDLSSLVENS